jgi:EAL domain-containing protein (putative c-di-GMP-specific phosphodiesterase class I)
MAADLTDAMGQTIDPLRLMQRVTDCTLELIGAADGVMVGVAGDHGVTYVSGAGNQMAHLGTRVELGSSLSGRAVRTGVVQRSDDTESDPRVDRATCRKLSVASLVCVPLRRKQETIGVLAVNAARPHAFVDHDVDLLTQLADFISVVVGSACDLARVKNQLLRLSEQTLAGAAKGDGHRITADAATRYVMNILSPDTVDEIESGERIQAILDEPSNLTMVFQPIVDLTTNRIAAVEALARFEATPYRPPNVWFAEAHENGLGVELEVQAVRRALAQLPRLPDGVDLTINAGPETVVSPQFLEAIDGQTGRIIVELTEHTVVADYPRLIATLNELRQAGIRISVDDTGAGHASLTHILKIAPDYIKLDRDLVSRIDVDPVRRALAAALVTFATCTGAALVAEGVEDDAELEVLRTLGVRYGQGYFLGHPEPLELLAHSHSLTAHAAR